MANWWPIDTDEHRGDTCRECGADEGLSRGDKKRVYCPKHRHLHDD